MLWSMILHVRRDYETMVLEEECTALRDKIQRMIENYNDCDHLYARKVCIYCGKKNDEADNQSNQSQVDVDRCQHEDDGYTHSFGDDGGSFIMRRCIKCGEFYR